MPITIRDKKECCGCHACANACPQKCVSMEIDEEGFWYPHINNVENCIDCGVCKQVCPILHSVVDSTESEPFAYAVKNMNDDERKNSSSGGLFVLLAKQTLKEGGIVFGAALSDTCRSLEHIGVEYIENLHILQGSKYLQSKIGDSYCQVKTALDSGKTVLFSGTPCQIEGLHRYLKKDYENLLCVDLACHGVPSPKVWNHYVSYQESIADASVQKISFRSKKHGWKKFSVLLEFNNATIYEATLSKDLFMQAFMNNICLRPCCSSCHFKKLNRVADITLADFWGIEGVLPEFYDDRGVSLALVHSNKGMHAMKRIESQMCFMQVETQEAISGNAAILSSVTAHRNRKKFFRALNEMPFDQLVQKYVREKLSIKYIIAISLDKLGLREVIHRIRHRNW